MVDILSPTSEHQKNVKTTPPPSPPSSGEDTKLSKKRERELSLEPVVTPTCVDPNALREPRDTRASVKKNRTVSLDPTEEEDDGFQSRSESGSPPLGISIPQEMKIRVRQISQGVEDLSWRRPLDAQPVGDNYDPPIPLVTEDDEAKDAHHEGVSSSPPLNTINDSGNHVDSVAEPEGLDKGLKRKFVERGTSLGPFEEGGRSRTAEELSKRSRDDVEKDDDSQEISPQELIPPKLPKNVVLSSKSSGTGFGSTLNEEKHNAPAEPLKRPRDNAEQDDNPRETKRPSPPPEQKSPKSPKKSVSSTLNNLGGFMAYASSNSPFADVKGYNVFAKPTQIAPLPFSTLSPPNTPLASTVAGFEAFTSSPFASVARTKSPGPGSTSKLRRAKSPIRCGQSANAFSPYAAGLQSFTASTSKRTRAGSPTGTSLERNGNTQVPETNGGSLDSEAEDENFVVQPTSFSEKLRAGRDQEEENKSDEDQSKVILTEQSVLTGEEEDETVHQVRGKLFLLTGAQWKERGSGTLKLNVRRSDGRGARLVMRKEAVYTLLLNVTLFHGMGCSLAQDPRYLRFSTIEDNVAMHYNLKLANAKIAKELLEEINANIPDAR